MQSRERMLSALNRELPDRVPCTTHHIMPYFLEKYLGGKSTQQFFDEFGLDSILWTSPHIPDPSRKEYLDPNQDGTGFLENRRIVSDDWRIESQEIPDDSYHTVRYNIVTPQKTLTTVIQSNEYTAWVSEHLVKEKSDMEIIAQFGTFPISDVEKVNQQAAEFGDRGLVRGHICCFDLFGQPGCWQDACCLVGTEKMMMATFDDPAWVHEFLTVLQKRKLHFIQSLKGAHFDLLELGGGDASTTVISPDLFREYVAPYDKPLVEAAHEAGQRIVYHTCGGMMPILEDIVGMGVDAIETLTPPEMGGDVNLAEVKRRVGDQVCLIGGFNQTHYFKDCSPEDTRRQVRQCFDQAGGGGGYILAPSDHFFDVEIELLYAFADEVKKCTY